MKCIHKSVSMAAVSVAMILGASQKSSALQGPCDILQAAGDPCGAALSTVRALFGSYSGNLYQVRNANGGTKDIGVLSTGYVANSATQDAFCNGTTCTISKIYDQTGNGNDLTKSAGGSAVYGPQPDLEAVATALPIQLDGHRVYGVHVTPNNSWTGSIQVGYRHVGVGKGIATGDNPETIYEVIDGTYANGACCFDFGNTETAVVAGGYGSMEAIYFGTNTWWDYGVGGPNGGGPWIMADLEVGVYNMGGSSNYSDANKNGNHLNSNDISFTYPFVTAMLKGNSKSAVGGGPFTLKGGNAQSGTLATVWDGAYPVGYSPMNRQGGVVLGTGGDNSGQSQGNFFEGVMTTGYASTATDALIQANIVAAGYGRTTTSIAGRGVRSVSPAIVSFDASRATALVGYSVENPSHVRIRVMDFQGREVARIVDGEVSAGRHDATWDAKPMHSGIYALVMDVEGSKVWSGNVIVGR